MNRRKIGSAYEERAAGRLALMGYRITDRNFRCRQGEIDLIARDGSYLVFIEVRYRRTAGMGHPLETVTPAKQRTICRVSDVYRMQKGIPSDVPVRYDVVAILGDEIDVVKNAFSYVAKGDSPSR